MRTPARTKILVVDDERVIATTLCAILEQQGYSVQAAFDGAEAVEIAPSFGPDLLLSDVVMPRLNGVQAAMAIVKILPKCRVLLFSGQANAMDLLAEARAEGFDFALVAKPIHPSELTAKVKELASGSRAPLILHVDDDDALRYAMTHFLSRAGLRTIEAASGKEAIRLAAAKLPDLIILDLNLPDMDGFEVCKKLKASPKTREIPVVHLTSTFRTAEARTASANAGADDYLTHPIQAQDLLEHVTRLLRVKAANTSL